MMSWNSIHIKLQHDVALSTSVDFFNGKHDILDEHSLDTSFDNMGYSFIVIHIQRCSNDRGFDRGNCIDDFFDSRDSKRDIHTKLSK